MAQAATSPVRWLIAAELKRYRSEARMTLAQAAERAGMSVPKLGHLEVGRQQQAPEDIAALLTVYGASARDIERLSALTGRADEAMWWLPRAPVVPDWLRTYVGLEALAESEFTFQPLVVPGLLQTVSYAAALTAASPFTRPDHRERVVSFKMARNRRLTDPERPLSLHSVVTESALRLAVGTSDVRREQLEHLLAMAEQPTVTIQVIRPEDGPHSALSGAFVLLDFGSAARPVVYVELKDGAVYLQEEMQVDTYSHVMRDLEQVAMSPEQSRELIASML